ncbi:ClbS/DfsB family four-helix bundle protein [Vagococcus sp.]|uniref:ClbS/DfsB family four-helix bundle protein n=1 Tax=Vagococcus sp. TaxID=1933889 RepID=UPI003F94CCD9
MTRPKSKGELLTQAELNFRRLCDLIASLSQEEQLQTFSFDSMKEKGAHWQRDKNIRDVLAHLYEWHQLLLEWVSSNQEGQPRPFLKEGYNWRTYSGMNLEFWECHQETPLNELKEKLSESHRQVLESCQLFSDTELFEKNIFSWVGGSTLGSYYISATSSHYEWALKKIKKHKKSLSNLK